jgi:hypothetical protein
MELEFYCQRCGHILEVECQRSDKGDEYLTFKVTPCDRCTEKLRDNITELWHMTDEDFEGELYEWLDMSWEQYALWARGRQGKK